MRNNTNTSIKLPWNFFDNRLTLDLAVVKVFLVWVLCHHCWKKISRTTCTMNSGQDAVRQLFLVATWHLRRVLWTGPRCERGMRYDTFYGFLHPFLRNHNFPQCLSSCSQRQVWDTITAFFLLGLPPCTLAAPSTAPSKFWETSGSRNGMHLMLDFIRTVSPVLGFTFLLVQIQTINHKLLDWMIL